MPPPLSSGDATIGEAVELAEGFAILIGGRAPEGLSAWLSRAEGSSVAGLRPFAGGIRHDQEAVRAGIGRDRSHGPVEGHIIQVKAIERTMYGRAKFDLLRARVPHAG